METLTTRAVFAGVLGLALLGVASAPSNACECVAATPADHFAGATLVFVGKAAEPRETDGAYIQPFTVLATLKSPTPLGKTYDLETPSADRTKCDRVFRAGEVTLVFVDAEGRANRCRGNADISLQADHLAAYLAASSKPSRPAPFSAMRSVLTAALADFLHAPTNVKPHIVYVVYDDHRGKSFRVRDSTLTFVPKPRLRPIVITAAERHGDVVLVEGTYASEGVFFRGLVVMTGKKAHLVGHWVLER